MKQQLFYSFTCLCLVACSTPSDKYRDTKSLELPPTLVIEHTNYAKSAVYDNKPETVPAPVEKSKPNRDNEDEKSVAKEGSAATESKAQTKTPQEKSNAVAELSKLVLLVGDEKKPTLQLKTRFDRAWILVANGLSSADIEVVDRDMEAGTFKVRYIDKGEGKGRGLLNSVTSFFDDKFEDTEYKLTLDKDKKTTDVNVDKLVKAEPNSMAFNNDDSAALIKLLHKTIIDDLAK